MVSIISGQRSAVRGGLRLFIVAVLLHWSLIADRFAVASGPGTSAADSLNLGMGPRASGMGEAFTGLADDASAIYWNPAGLSRLYVPEASFTYLDLFGDTQQHYAAYAHPFPARGAALGASVSYLRVTPFQGYDNSAGKAGTVGASDMVLSVAGAQRWDRLAAGASLKYIRSDLAGAHAQTPSMDVGLAYLSRRTAREGRLDLGAAGSNLFGKLKYDSLAFKLPRSYRVGASWSKAMVSDDILTLSGDAIRSDASKKTEFAAGAEYWLVNLVALRAGFRTGQEIGSGFRAGLGLRIRSLEFDYAYAGFGDLGVVHRAAVSFRFGETREPAALEASRLFERAEYLDAQGRYLEEVLTLNRILDIDPGNAAALERMKTAAEKVKKEKRP